MRTDDNEIEEMLGELNWGKLPEHVAIIMDGNGRWAKQKQRSRTFGHLNGIESVREIVRTSRQLGIKVLTLYAFSSANWGRPSKEVKTLMRLLKKYLQLELNELMENNIKLTAIGQLDRLPKGVRQRLLYTMEKTESNDGMILNLAISYTGREEIIESIKKLIKDYDNKVLSFENITEECFSHYLFTARLPDPDLLIRTSGEKRLSNFLLWQTAYTEIYVTDTLWPDFRKKHFLEALLDYQRRERRFGLISEQLQHGYIG